ENPSATAGPVTADRTIAATTTLSTKVFTLGTPLNERWKSRASVRPDSPFGGRQRGRGIGRARRLGNADSCATPVRIGAGVSQNRADASRRIFQRFVARNSLAPGPEPLAPF